MHTPDDYIAVFDSGVGGISVLRQLRRIMKDENYLYFGDSANAPYGSRSTEEVRRLTLAAAEQLFREYPVKALVVACNTATSAAIGLLRKKYPEKVIIGIEPALKLAADLFPGGHIGVMATEVTLREEKFDTLAHRFDQDCTVTRIPAPGLVQFIEANRRDTTETKAYLQTLLSPYIGKLDALVLGCTHYPFVKHNIQDIMGPRTRVIHGGEGTARETKRRLRDSGLLRQGEGKVIIKNSLSDPEIIRLCYELLG